MRRPRERKVDRNVQRVHNRFHVCRPAVSGPQARWHCNSDIRVNYGDSGWVRTSPTQYRRKRGNVHFGVTGGYAEANAQDLGGSNFTGNFQIPSSAFMPPTPKEISLRTFSFATIFIR